VDRLIHVSKVPRGSWWFDSFIGCMYGERCDLYIEKQIMSKAIDNGATGYLTIERLKSGG
jgi:hypothetical protein